MTYILSKIVTPYNLRAHRLPVPHITHNYAELRLVYQLVKMKNSITINDKLTLQKNEEKSHSVSRNVLLQMYFLHIHVYCITHNSEKKIRILTLSSLYIYSAIVFLALFTFIMYPSITESICPYVQ